MKQINTIKLLLKTKAMVSSQIDRYDHIENEFDQFENFVMPKASRKKRDALLYRFLHLTRAADTSLRLIVVALSLSIQEYHMKSYLRLLKQKGLLSSDEKKFVDKVVHPRNEYVHAADKYISIRELNEIESVVYEMLQKALVCM